MNSLGRAVLNSGLRAAVQRRHLVPELVRLGGGDLAGLTTLEVGCGRGIGAQLLLRQMAAARVIAIDLDPVMARMARDRAGDRCGVAVADMTVLPAANASYDAVVDFGGLHLVPNWTAAVAEVARVLRPGGVFLFEQPAHLLYRLVVPLATGRRVPGGFQRKAFFDQLLRNDMTLLGVGRPHPLIATGMRGDLVGVARKAS